MVDGLKRLLALPFVLVWPQAAPADEALPDPTRPPAAARIAAPASAAAADVPLLQSVLTGPGRRPAALISGALVLLGERYGDATLIGVTDESAVLRGPQGQTRLMLIPGVDKQAHRAETGASERPAPRVAPPPQLAKALP